MELDYTKSASAWSVLLMDSCKRKAPVLVIAYPPQTWSKKTTVTILPSFRPLHNNSIYSFLKPFLSCCIIYMEKHQRINLRRWNLCSQIEIVPLVQVSNNLMAEGCSHQDHFGDHSSSQTTTLFHQWEWVNKGPKDPKGHLKHFGVHSISSQEMTSNPLRKKAYYPDF